MPAPGKEEIPTMIQAQNRVAEELVLCGKGPGGLGRQRGEHEPAACPGTTEQQQTPRLH